MFICNQALAAGKTLPDNSQATFEGALAFVQRWGQWEGTRHSLMVDLHWDR